MKSNSPTTMQKLGISAVILTHNEEGMIANCMETLRWCDEIIIVDNGSEDATVELAKSLGARVVSTLSKNFASLRDAGLQAVKTDWVFYIDADERVTPELYQEIAVHVETNDTDVLSMKRKNICYGYHLQHGGWNSDVVTRVFRRDALKNWQGDIHESPIFEGRELLLHRELLHFTHRSTQLNLLKSAEWTIKEAQLLHEAYHEPITVTTLLRKGLMEVIRRVIFKQGYKDGMAGWVEGFVQGINRMIVYIQVWELQQQPTLPERYQALETDLAHQWRQHQ